METKMKENRGFPEAATRLTSSSLEPGFSLLTLGPDHVETIHRYVDGFKEWLRGKNGTETMDEIGEKMRVIDPLLAKEHISQLTEAEFGTVLRQLWALNFWGNKDFKIQQVLQQNGIGKLRRELSELLYGKGSIGRRYDNFKQSVKGFGPAILTEILITIFPGDCCLWNEKPKNVLPVLGVGKLLPDRVFKTQITGDDYEKCNQLLRLIGDELRRSGVKGIGDPGTVDFQTVDLFMWYIFDEAMPRDRPYISLFSMPVSMAAEVSSHEEAEAILLELGNLLGYEGTFTADPSKEYDSKVLGKKGKLSEIATLDKLPAFTYERLLGPIRKIDVIWFQEELPQACFEVEHTTNVKDGLLRELNAGKFSAARLFIVGPEDQRSKFDSEISREPFYKFRGAYVFRSYNELIEYYLAAWNHRKALSKFFGYEVGITIAL